jgi:hypothetical protein
MNSAMKRNAVLICLALAAVTAASFAQKATKPVSAQAQILDIERRWAEQVVTNDVETLNQILASDYVGVEPDGRHMTKEESIAEAKAGPSEFASNRLNDDVKVRVYAEFAVAQGTETFKRQDGKVGRFIWTDTFIKRDGRWQVVASQDLEVAGEK